MLLSAFFICLLSTIALSSDVLEFTDDTFDSRIGDYSIILVEFFAPWCGHCKALAPHYEEAATRLSVADVPLPIAKVDCIANPKTCEKFGVSGYPTLKIFKDGAFAFDYDGPRTADGIVNYMITKASPATRELFTLAEVEKFVSGLNPVLMGYFEKKDGDLQKTFQGAANSLSEDFKFAFTYDASLFPKNFGSGDLVVLHRPKIMENKFEDSMLKYTGDVSNQMTLKSWITDNAMGLCGFRTQNNEKHFPRPLLVVHYSVDYERNAKGSNYWRNRVMKVAEKFAASKSWNFAVSNAQEFSGDLNGEFGFQDIVDTKLYVTARNAAGEKFRMEDEFSMDALEKFVTQLTDKTIKPYLKSEVPPSASEQAKNDVKVVVGSTFNDIVNDPTKDVLIEFYAPWCGHCKSLAPKYEELAVKLKAESDIVIAKMDATANDVPAPYTVSGFPTIYFAPKGSKSRPKSYDSEREVDDFIKFLARESTNTLKGWKRDGTVITKSEL